MAKDNPLNLEPDLLSEIAPLVEKTAATPLADLLAQAQQHTAEAKEHSDKGGAAAHKLAAAINEGLQQVGEKAGTFDDLQERWFKATILYFIHCEDEEHDFETVLGFDDDAIIYNAFCDFANLPDFKIDAKGFI